LLRVRRKAVAIMGLVITAFARLIRYQPDLNSSWPPRLHPLTNGALDARIHLPEHFPASQRAGFNINLDSTHFPPPTRPARRKY